MGAMAQQQELHLNINHNISLILFLVFITGFTGDHLFNMVLYLLYCSLTW
jgi:hypothetical protein